MCTANPSASPLCVITSFYCIMKKIVCSYTVAMVISPTAHELSEHLRRRMEADADVYFDLVWGETFFCYGLHKRNLSGGSMLL